jgi:hypothetical protein
MLQYSKREKVELIPFFRAENVVSLTCVVWRRYTYPGLPD